MFEVVIVLPLELAVRSDTTTEDRLVHVCSGNDD